jgi:hypothetical protein
MTTPVSATTRVLIRMVLMLPLRCSGRVVASLHRNRLGQKVRVSLVADPRRFRLGDEKEAAGAAVAVIVVGIMEIE